MNEDMIGMYLKHLITKSLASGGTTMLSELAESLSTESLGKLIDILKKVYDKKRNVVNSR